MSQSIRITVYVLLWVAVVLPLATSQQWGDDIRIPDQQGEAMRPDICTDSNDNIHIVWSVDHSYLVCYTRSTDGGATWADETTIFSDQAIISSICADDFGNIHVVCLKYHNGDNQTFYKRSTDQGVTWENEVPLGLSSSEAVPRICSDSEGNLHLAFSRRESVDKKRASKSRMYYKRSSDGGTNWENEILIDENDSSLMYPVFCTGPSNDLHLAWANESEGIYHTKSTDGGLTWGAITTVVSFYFSIMPKPDICTDSAGNIHLVGGTFTTNCDVVYRRSTDNGITWEDGLFSPQTAGDNWSGYICVDPLHNVHVVWSNTDGNTTGLYHNISEDGGTTWGTDTLLSNTKSGYFLPICADSNGNLHLAWDVSLSGDWDIYYKKGIQRQNPVVDVKCNGEDTGVVVTKGDNCVLTFNIEARDYPNQRCDIWLIGSSSATQRYYSFGNYSSPDWRLGVGNVYSTGPLQDCFGTMLDRPLPIGSYTVYGILDYRANGKLNVPAFWVQDEVDFTVVE